jgi:hypothetical protein
MLKLNFFRDHRFSIALAELAAGWRRALMTPGGLSIT